MVIADCNTHFELDAQPGVCIQTQVGSAARKGSGRLVDADQPC